MRVSRVGVGVHSEGPQGVVEVGGDDDPADNGLLGQR